MIPGLTTWAKPKQAVYLQDNLSGETVLAGVFDEKLPGPGNQMVLVQDAFTSVGVPVLERCMESDSPWIAIDEIGYLEAQCVPYHEALHKLLEKKQTAMAVRKQDLPFLNELCGREDVFLVDLDDPFGNIGCVIMASGLGKRFGGNKLMADFYGQPMICRILDATEGLFSNRIVVTRHESVANLCASRDIPVILHDLPHRSDTVRLGLEVMADTDHCMFCPGDLPLLTKNTMASLLLCAQNKSDSIWRTCCNNTPGSPVLFPRWTFPELRSLPEGKGGNWVIKNHPDKTDMLHISESWELMDVDTQETLELLKRKQSLRSMQ